MDLSERAVRERRAVMKCEEALTRISAYIDNTLSGRELEEFIEHVEHCPECYDELETYYTIKVGINYLEQDRQDAYNIPQMLKKDLERKKDRLHQGKVIRSLAMALAVTLAVAGILWLAASWGDLALPRIF